MRSPRKKAAAGNGRLQRGVDHRAAIYSSYITPSSSAAQPIRAELIFTGICATRGIIARGNTPTLTLCRARR
jgi:hypothetical protein